MKSNSLIHYVLSVILTFSVSGSMASAETDKPVSHVIMVWLKDSGSHAARQKFVEASEKLNDLPGIVNRHVGIVVPSERAVVDDTFDVAITVTLKNQQALETYMNHPRHKKIVEQQLKPLVNRIVAYNFKSE